MFPYTLPDGSTRREYRPAEEVFADDSLSTLAHAPVTDLHPEREGVRIPVTPENYKDLSVGHVAENVRPMADHVSASLLVQDQDMILKIENGMRRECSAGYSCTLDQTPGVTNQGEVYDAIQRNIRYNHVALGPDGWGRAGSTVALRLDSGDAVQATQKETIVENEIIDGVSYKVSSPEWAAAKNKFTVKVTGERDAAMGRADAAEKATAAAKVATPDPKAMKEAVIKRVRLITDCKRIATAVKVRFDDEAAAVTGEQDLLLEAIKMLDPSFDGAGKSPEYVAGYFASLVKTMGADEAAETSADDKKEVQEPVVPGAAPVVKTDSAKTSIFSARQGTGSGGSDRQDNGPDPDKARAGMVQKNKDAWKRPLGPNAKN